MKAVIMAGGQGTRFWPASRRGRPKQFLNILGQRTMLQETMARLDPLLGSSDLFVVCPADYVQDVRTQAPGLSDAQVIVEPAPRNTAACIGLAAQKLARRSADDVMVALPADHSIRDVDELHQLLASAETLARDGWLVTFGIRPTFAATGYGYLERGESLGRFGGKEAFRVRRFLEKPDAGKARKLLESGGFDWNSGIFVWKVSRILEEIERSMPDLHEALTEISRDPDDVQRGRRAFERLGPVSVDYGVMEKAERVASFPADLGWSDVGSWPALAELLPKDEQGNVANSFLVGLDSRDCMVHASSGKLVALVGVEDLIVVETPDALLICPRERSEEVQKVVAELHARKLEEYL